jgi:hypothetical protein
MAAVTPAVVEAVVETDVTLAVRVSGREDRPVVDRVVLWRVQQGPGAQLEAQLVRTDRDGVARATLRLPMETGRIEVLAAAYQTELPQVRFEVIVVPGPG